MKKFDELMHISNEITNISVDEAKEKLNDPNVQFIDVRDKDSFCKKIIHNGKIVVSIIFSIGVFRTYTN